MADVALYHYTCEHGMLAIVADTLADSRQVDLDLRDGGSMPGPWLRPTPQLCLPGRPELLWCTPEFDPDPEALGLTSNMLRCDRTQYRWWLAIDNPAEPWLEWLSRQSREVRRAARRLLPGSPRLWWVSESPVRAHLVGDPR